MGCAPPLNASKLGLLSADNPPAARRRAPPRPAQRPAPATNPARRQSARRGLQPWQAVSLSLSLARSALARGLRSGSPRVGARAVAAAEGVDAATGSGRSAATTYVQLYRYIRRVPEGGLPAGTYRTRVCTNGATAGVPRRASHDPLLLRIHSTDPSCVLARSYFGNSILY